MVTVSFPLLSVPLSIILAYLPHFLRIFLVSRSGKYDNAKPRDHASQHASVPEHVGELAKRLAACHKNQIETIGFYAAGIVACVAVNEDDSTLVILSALYVGFRAAYVAVYAAPQVLGGLLRTLVFGACLAVVSTIWSRLHSRENF